MGTEEKNEEKLEEDKKKNKKPKILIAFVISVVLVILIFHFVLDDGDKLVNFNDYSSDQREVTNSYYKVWR